MLKSSPIGGTPAHRALSVTLQGYRELIGVSQRSAARLAGLAISHLGRIESLTGRPSADSLWRLSSAISGVEGHPGSDRWRVLMASAHLSWPEPQFLLAAVGAFRGAYDADLVWAWAVQ
jgi:transcriptional regulator with XRE-family HTH domain